MRRKVNEKVLRLPTILIAAVILLFLCWQLLKSLGILSNVGPARVEGESQYTPHGANTSNWWSYPSEFKQTNKNGDDLLVLVSKEFRLSSDYSPSDLVDARKSKIRTVGEVKLREILISNLESLAAAAKADGINLSITSGYRSYRDQEFAFNYWVNYNQGDVSAAERISARPGHSQHQLGTALDFSSSEVDDQSVHKEFKGTRAASWLAQHAWKFGFVLAYAEGAEHQTRYSYESWHYRYIGMENAASWKQSGLVLDEWLKGI